MAYVSANMYAVDLRAQVNLVNGRIAISAGDISFMAMPVEAAELGRQIAVALEQLGEVPDSLPPITPPVALSDAEMAEGDECEVRR